ncbi:12977_t:CDS:2, partial [Gigaspora rosea]
KRKLSSALKIGYAKVKDDIGIGQSVLSEYGLKIQFITSKDDTEAFKISKMCYSCAQKNYGLELRRPKADKALTD